MMTMKILLIAPYMTNNTVPLLSQCKAGFGYMVYDIAASIAKKVSVEALLYNYRYPDFKSDSIQFVGCSFRLFLNNIIKCSPVWMPLKLYMKYHMHFRTFIRLCYGWLLSGYYREVIKKGGYDVVHIHGCGFINEYFIDICKHLNMPFVVTLHGLNSFSDSVKLESAGKRYEKDFLKETLEKGYTMTVIASGIKRTIMQYFRVEMADNIKVVNNAFSFSRAFCKSIDIKQIYAIPHSSKILMYVGNICERKNQKQIINAYNLLNENEKDNLYILFLGRDIEPDYGFSEFVNKQEYKNHFRICGNIDKELMPAYYKASDYVTLLSFSEGFGLSLIEALHFGLPCMAFDFVDAYNDIYNPCCMIGLHETSDLSVSKGLRNLISRDWNKKTIKEYSMHFEADAMADKYINVYKEIQQ